MIAAFRQMVRALGPSAATATPKEAVRAGVGALIGLGLTGLLVLSPVVDLRLGLYLIAPFGATSVLVFAVPNSPLAQPWNAVLGNTLAGLVGVAVCLTVPDPALRIALAVGLSIALMIPLRAVHPPAGAVAMTAAMNPEAVRALGFGFALAPVAIGTVILVGVAMVYARLTGRHYPLRQFDDRNDHGTGNPAPSQRLNLSGDELTAIIERYRQSLNLGVEDLARLLGAAEMQAAGHRTGALRMADIMSRDVISVAPDTPVARVAHLFRQHRFTALPVVGADGSYCGLIFQHHLIGRAHDEAFGLNRGFAAAMARLLDRGRDAPPLAGNIMGAAQSRVAPDTPIAALLPMMTEGGSDAVPVLLDTRIVGIVTRTDLIAALARQSVRGG